LSSYDFFSRPTMRSSLRGPGNPKGAKRPRVSFKATVSTIVDPAPPHSDDLDSMRAGAATAGGADSSSSARSPPQDLEASGMEFTEAHASILDDADFEMEFTDAVGQLVPEDAPPPPPPVTSPPRRLTVDSSMALTSPRGRILTEPLDLTQPLERMIVQANSHKDMRLAKLRALQRLLLARQENLLEAAEADAALERRRVEVNGETVRRLHNNAFKYLSPWIVEAFYPDHLTVGFQCLKGARVTFRFGDAPPGQPLPIVAREFSFAHPGHKEFCEKHGVVGLLETPRSSKDLAHYLKLAHGRIWGHPQLQSLLTIAS